MSLWGKADKPVDGGNILPATKLYVSRRHLISQKSLKPVRGKAEVGSHSSFEKLISCLSIETFFTILIGFEECVRHVLCTAC
jgi:hypothetical protein